MSGNESRGRAAGICAVAGVIRNSTIADYHSDLEGGGGFAPGWGRLRLIAPPGSPERAGKWPDASQESAICLCYTRRSA